MLPEMSLSALPRYLLTGVMAMTAIAVLSCLAAPNPQAAFDRTELARLSGKKVIDWDPVITGSVPRPAAKKGIRA